AWHRGDLRPRSGMNHDIVAIGASAGGVGVLLDLAGELPGDLAAAVFVVVHQSADHVSPLPELLSRRGPLPATHPVHGQAIEPGAIYVAPPDNHLQLRPGFIEVVRGPKDNGHRPAADVLFRTAAAAYGPRVIGVVLSGYHDCGTAGMMSIKARGGLAVVQDPATALAADMPRHVLERVAVDHVVAPRARPLGAPAAPASAPGPILPLDGSADGEQAEETERVLWGAVRALEECAGMARRLSHGETGELRRRFAEKAQTQTQHADYLRQL